MRCFLSGSYAIGHGEVFSADEDRSRQVDVIIHDELFSPVFRTDDGGILVPCEAVYGTAEVKTRLDREGWELALENVASVKRLERAPADDWGLESSATECLFSLDFIMTCRRKIPPQSNVIFGRHPGTGGGLATGRM